MQGSRPQSRSPFWQANLKVLRRRAPAVVSFLEGEASDPAAAAEVAIARTGEPTLALISESGRMQLHSRYDPRQEAERWAENLELWGSHVVVVFGFGLGYHIEALLRRCPQCQIVVVEPHSGVLAAAFGARNLASLLSQPNLTLVVGTTAQRMAAQVFQVVKDKMLSRPAFLAWPAAQRLYGALWQEVQRHLVDYIRQRTVNLATHNRFAARWLTNFFANFAASAVDPGTASLFERFAGRPAILVAAGPSLHRNGHLLHRAKGRALILAAGSAIHPLLKLGVEPDLLVSMDAGEGNYLHFKGLNLPTVPLVYPPTIYPAIIHEYKGPRFAVGLDVFPFADWAFSALGSEKGTLASGPSVANTAWDLARRLGCDPIILVGQDLAYTENQTHAEGARHRRTLGDEVQRSPNYFFTEDIHGDRVLTNKTLYSMKVAFEQLIAHHGEKVQTIDATEGGVRIKGTQLLTLREALGVYGREEFHPHEAIRRIHTQEQARRDEAEVQEKMGRFLAIVEEQLAALEDVYRRAVEVAEPLVQASSRGTVKPRKITEANQRFHALDEEMAANEAYRYFVHPTLVDVRQVVLSSSARDLGPGKAPAQRGEALARAYLSWFRAGWERAQQIRALARHHLTDANPSPSSPGQL